MNQKVFLTYEQQINKLQNEKSLIINDSEYATAILKKISYYPPCKNSNIKKKGAHAWTPSAVRLASNTAQPLKIIYY